MLLTKKQLLLSLAGALLLGTSSFAEEGDAGHGSVEFGLGFYYNGDSDNGKDGNPYLDEELAVVEPVVIFSYNLTDDSSVWGNVSYDIVSSASIDRLSETPHQTGASGDFYVGVDLGYKKEIDKVSQWGTFGHVSVEYDYTSLGVGGDYEKELPALGASYKASLSGFLDVVKVINYAGINEGNELRTSMTGQFAWYQEMTPKSHAEYGAVATLQNGFLETAYNSVVLESLPGNASDPKLVGNASGLQKAEELSDVRIRGALFGRYRYSLTESSALELGGRYYADDWGITSYTVEPRWYYWLVDEKLKMRLRYRFYTQTKADAYEEHYYTSTPTFRTQDSDLAAFDAHTYGALFTIYTQKETEWDIGMDYIQRDDNLNQIIGRVSYRRNF